MGKKGTRKVKSDAEKAADFKRLAAKKVNSIARAADGLAKMATARYAYTPAQVKQIAQFLAEKIEGAIERLNGKKAGASEGFNFGE